MELKLVAVITVKCYLPASHSASSRPIIKTGHSSGNCSSETQLCVCPSSHWLVYLWPRLTSFKMCATKSAKLWSHLRCDAGCPKSPTQQQRWRQSISCWSWSFSCSWSWSCGTCIWQNRMDVHLVVRTWFVHSHWGAAANAAWQSWLFHSAQHAAKMWAHVWHATACGMAWHVFGVS